MHAIERNLIHMKRALIIGGGPAGLTAAYELLKGSKAKNPPEEIEVIVLEESGLLGGISKTVNYNGNRMDMGGHRFFSKDPKVNAWWKEMLPPQGLRLMMTSSCTGRRRWLREALIRRNATGLCLPGTGYREFILIRNFLITLFP